MRFRSKREWLEAVLKDKEQMRRELAQLPCEEKKTPACSVCSNLPREVAKVREQLRRRGEGNKHEF